MIFFLHWSLVSTARLQYSVIFFFLLFFCVVIFRFPKQLKLLRRQTEKSATRANDFSLTRVCRHHSTSNCIFYFFFFICTMFIFGAERKIEKLRQSTIHVICLATVLGSQISFVKKTTFVWCEQIIWSVYIWALF